MKKKRRSPLYPLIKTINKKARKHAPNPTNSLNAFGLIGKVLSCTINFLIKKPIHCLTFLLAGIWYNKKVDNPCKGSFLYTLIYFIIMILLSGMFAMLVHFIVV